MRSLSLALNLSKGGENNKGKQERAGLEADKGSDKIF